MSRELGLGKAIGEMSRVMESGKRWVKLRERKLKVLRVKSRDLRLNKEAG